MPWKGSGGWSSRGWEPPPTGAVPGMGFKGDAANPRSPRRPRPLPRVYFFSYEGLEFVPSREVTLSDTVLCLAFVGGQLVVGLGGCV